MNLTKAILVVIAFVLLIGLVFTMRSCTTVPSGNVGVKFNLYGSDKGVKEEVVGPGRYFLTLNEDMYLFPTFQQTYVYTIDTSEENTTNESFSFQTKEGLEINTDVGVTFHIDADRADILFQTYRKGLDELISGPLRGIIRDAFVKVASDVSVEFAYGEGKTVLMDTVERYVRDYFTPQGIVIDRLYLVGSFRLPKVVLEALNAKIAATQTAQKFQNEVAQAEAEALKKIAQARGDSASMVTRAAGESQAMKLKMLTLNELLIRYETIKQWDGKLPTVTGGSIPMIELPSTKK